MTGLLPAEVMSTQRKHSNSVTKKSICHFLYGKQNNAKNNGKDELTGILNKIARWFSIYFLEYKDDYEKRAFKNGLMILEQESIMVEQK